MPWSQGIITSHFLLSWGCTQDKAWRFNYKPVVIFTVEDLAPGITILRWCWTIKTKIIQSYRPWTSITTQWLFSFSILCSRIDTCQKIFNEVQWVERLAKYQPETQHCKCDIFIAKSLHKFQPPRSHLMTKMLTIQTHTELYSTHTLSPIFSHSRSMENRRINFPLHFTFSSSSPSINCFHQAKWFDFSSSSFSPLTSTTSGSTTYNIQK